VTFTATASSNVDCDAAGIVYYLNEYRWMDGTDHVLTASLDADQRVVKERHGHLGTPLVDAHAPSPAR
jgi:acyl-CoA thioesterase FadM